MVIVTGDRGFIGSELKQYLINKGYTVHSIRSTQDIQCPAYTETSSSFYYYYYFALYLILYLIWSL